MPDMSGDLCRVCHFRTSVELGELGGWVDDRFPRETVGINNFSSPYCKIPRIGTQDRALQDSTQDTYHQLFKGLTGRTDTQDGSPRFFFFGRIHSLKLIASLPLKIGQNCPQKET